MTSAARVARHRERARDGRRIFALELDAVAVEAMLSREGLLDDAVEHDQRTVDAALARFIETLCEWHAL